MTAAAFWGRLSFAVFATTVVGAVLTLVILENFIHRPGSFSISTLLPGVAHATAPVIMTSLAAGVVAAAMALVHHGRAAVAGPSPWSRASVVLVPIAQPIGAVGAVIVEALVGKPDGLSLSYFPVVSRAGVFAMFACFVLGLVSAVVALVKDEQPRSLAMLGLALNMFLVGLFWQAQFFVKF